MKSTNQKTSKPLPAMILCLLLFAALPATDIVPFTDITPAQAAALIREKSADPLFVILDVRTTREFAGNWIKGARHIDVKAPDFKEQISKLDRNGIYLAYCKGGMRSARAMTLMKKWGFKEVYNLGGGLMKWQEEKLPLETAPLLADPPAK